MNPLYPVVAQRALFMCEYCQAPQDGTATPLEIEHIRLTADKGTNDLNNLAIACRSCNQFKHKATVGMDPQTSMQVPLLDPRRDEWDEHFFYEPETFSVVGETPVGRATVARLQMNNPFQNAARRIWRAAGLPF
ncbi:MAG: HNH endonuclease [Akkermansiaceae bacterium]|nr:HNH endonuclease [Armatimonadota bacterium]